MGKNDELVFSFDEEQHLSLFDTIKKQLKEGNVEQLDELFTSTDYHYDVEHIFFNDVALAITSFEYMWAQSSYIAIEEGVDAAGAGHLYEIHRRRLMNQSTVLGAIQENKDFHHALALMIRSKKEEVPYSKVVRESRVYIREHILEPPTVQSVADALGISRGHLSSLFKKETGQTMQEFIRALRLSAILEFLEDPMFTASEIWAMTGFCSQSHYIQFFKSMTGDTPKAYLRKKSEEENNNASAAARPLLYDLASSQEESRVLDMLDDYAESGGYKQQQFQLYCVQKGRYADLKRELTDPQYQKKMQTIFQGNRTMALETLLYLLPQISSAAIDGGLSMKSASRIYISIVQKTSNADCEELLRLLSQAYLDYAYLVAEMQIKEQD